MKIKLASDIHTEFDMNYAYSLNNNEEYDVLVIAGDVNNKKEDTVNSLNTISCIVKKPLLFVPGNHEYYYCRDDNLTMFEIDAYFKEQFKDHPYIHAMQNDEFILDDVVFIAGTLWTDMKSGANGAFERMYLEKSINDFRLIRFSRENDDTFRLLNTNDATKLFKQTKRFLTSKLKEHEGKKIVIVTHHAPSEKSVHKKYKDSTLNAAFVSNMDSFIKKSKVPLWIHGHVHDSFDYVLGNTRIVCNPKGYKDENTEFNPNLIVEI